MYIRFVKEELYMFLMLPDINN